jgi:hypothetical protein
MIDSMTRRARITIVICAAGLFGCDGQQGQERRVDPCVMKFPRGTNQVVASSDAITQAINECRGDDGECKAQAGCQGKPQDRDCNIQRLITSQAALCVAETHGLADGLTQPRTGLVYDYVYRRITWNVSNTMYDGARGARPDSGGGARGGQALTIDAINALVLKTSEWSADM